MYNEICYKNPFLKDVILRIDFLSPLPGVDKALPASISKSILKIFPLFEPTKVQENELQFSGSKVQTKINEINQWIFHGKEREKTIAILPGSISFTTKAYKSYEDFINNIQTILTEFDKEYKEFTSSRVGLRYVNVIDIKEENPLSWEDYIQEKILGIMDFHDEHNLTRAFHILEYNYDGQAVKFQFGMGNPDYPALIKRKQFILDIDSYFHGAFTIAEIIESIGSSHDKIQELFEKSITDKTRTLMKPVP